MWRSGMVGWRRGEAEFDVGRERAERALTRTGSGHGAGGPAVAVVVPVAVGQA